MSKPLTFNCVLHASATPRKIAVTAYSGGIMRVPGWGPVLIDLGRLELPETIPLLQDHNNAIDAVVGSGTPEIRSGKLVISGTLAPGEAGQMVADLLVGGHPLQASVGVDPTETRNLQSGESVQANGQTFTAGRNGLTLIVAGRLREVSVTPLGCDDSTSVRIAARAARGNKMDFHDWLKEKGFDPTNLSDDQRDALLAGYNSEQALKASGAGDTEGMLQASLGAARKSALSAAITAAATEHPGKLDVVERLGRQALEAGWSPERFQLEVYRGTAIQIDNQPRAATGATTDAVLQCAMDKFIGLNVEKYHPATVCQRADDLQIRSIRDWMAAVLRARGQSVPRDLNEMVRAVCRPTLQASGPSTITLPNSLDNGANKVLIDAYNVPPKTWFPWCARRPTKDFKQAKAIRMFTSRGLEEVIAGGEVKHGSLGEDVYTHQAKTFGELIMLDRRDIINDDLSALTDTPRQLGLEAARTVADQIYSKLIANVGSFFGSANGNYDDGSDSVLGATSLETAIGTFRKQTDSAGRVIDVPPSILLVPPELEFTARRLLNSGEVDRTAASADLAPTGNALKGMLDLQVEPRLSTATYTGNSTTAWYLFANPLLIPTMITSWLDGRESPWIEQVEMPGNYLGTGWRCVLDFGVDFGDYRGGVKYAGV